MSTKPIIFLAFANNRADPAHFLDKLAEEERRLRETLGQAAELCDVISEETATADEILAIFQQRRDRIAIFHFAGHANSYQLLLESADGQPAAANAGGFAAFLGQQTGLELVFLNGCSTQGQVEELLAANVPAVIATDQKIKDDVATDFAALFYGGLAAGASIRSAFEQARAGIRFKKGDKTRDLFEEDVAETTPASAIPWDLHALPNHDPSAWTLWEAAGSPLFGLPRLPERPLPDAPFPGLAPYTTDQAELFCGRGAEIRKLFDWATDATRPPILLLHGQTGAGKSSLLDAGLRSRLMQVQNVRYERRDPVRGLAAALTSALPLPAPAALGPQDAGEDERARGESCFTVILDQADEALTRPAAGPADELAELATALAGLFNEQTTIPYVKIILAFRTEALEAIRAALAQHGLADRCVEFPVAALGRAGIAEIVRAPIQAPRLRDRYPLKIDDALPEAIAADFAADEHSPIAPLLQVLLAEMWQAAASRKAPWFDKATYDDMFGQGVALRTFLDRQLETMRAENAAAVDSGLALDLLAHHTTPLGAAYFHDSDQLIETYPQHATALPGLVQRCQDLYLLADWYVSGLNTPQSLSHVHCLAHNALALVVRQRYGESDLPGQRGRRILEARAAAWEEDAAGETLDDVDLATVEAGEAGMRGRSEAEERLVAASRIARDRRRRNRKILIAAGITAIVLIALAAVIATWQRAAAVEARVTAEVRRVEAVEQRGTAQAESTRALQAEATAEVRRIEAVREAQRARAGELAVHAQNAIANNKDDPSLALLLAMQAVEVTWHAPENSVTVNADQALRDAIDAAPPWRMTLPRHRHGGPVTLAAYSPDGRFIVTASADRTARIWDAASGAAVRTLAGHTDWVASAAYSPDGRFIVTASGDKTVRIWDAASGAAVRTLAGHKGEVTSAAYSPDGRFIVTASENGTARIWEAASGVEVRTLAGHTGEVRSTAYSPDGRFIVTASENGTARIWDAASGAEVRTLAGHKGWVNSAAYSPDGRFIVTASDDWTARIWDVASGAEVRTLAGHAGSDTSAAYSPNGRFIVTASGDGTARIWDAASGAELRTLAGYGFGVNSAAYSPDGCFIVTAGLDGMVRIWDAASATEVRTLAGHTGEVDSAAYSPDGRFIVTAGGDGTARVWEAASGVELRTLAGHAFEVDSAAYSPDGHFIVTASADETARIWEAASGAEVRTLAGHDGSVTSAAYSPNGRFIVTASADKTARIWDAASGTEVRTLAGHTEPVITAAYSPDGRFIVTASLDKTARIWAVASGAEMGTLSGYKGWVNSAAYSPDGRFIVTASWDGTARIWDAASGAAVRTLAGHSEPVSSAAYSPNGRFIVTASEDGTARIWDAASSAEVRTLAGHTSYVRSAAYSPDGRFIVTASGDGTARIWEAASGAAVRTLTGHTKVAWSAAYSPDGRFIVTVSEDETARIWLASIADLLAEAHALIQRDPPLLTSEERRDYGLE